MTFAGSDTPALDVGPMARRQLAAQPASMLGLLVPVVATLILFAAALALRPLIPVGETRYMTVAWEMHLRGDWFAPLTLNFEPYHHKPPLLFWMIDAGWAVFCFSRWAAMVPIGLMAVACVVLTARIAKLVSPDDGRAALITAASAPMIIYGTTVMFDITLTACLLAAVLFVLRFARDGRIGNAVAAGLALGMGVLTKGPVAYVYVMPLMLLAPWWTILPCKPRRWYVVSAGIAILGLVPVALWIIPVALRTDGEFLVWLLWNQTAGRIAGNFGEAHVRPFYYYLPMIPALFLPWALLPAFWRGAAALAPGNPSARFLPGYFRP
jgi:4-amino-4-deoxy-L-arabinose transferase-like glycosyltransferase